MSGVGYPDWQRLDTRSGAALIYQTNTAAGPYLSPVEYTGNYQSMLLVIRPTGTSRYTGQIEFFQNANGTNPTVLTPFVFGAAGGDIVVPVSVVGPYFQVSVSAGTGAPTDSYLIALVPTTNEISAANLESTQLINTHVQSVPATSSLVVESANIWPGRASLLASCNAASGDIGLQYLDPTGTWQYMVEWPLTSASMFSAIVSLPFAPTRLQLVNNDAAAKNFICNLAILP